MEKEYLTVWEELMDLTIALPLLQYTQDPYSPNIDNTIRDRFRIHY